MYEVELMDKAALDEVQREILVTTWQMLEAIDTGDTGTYLRYCSPDLSCFEDVCAHRIDGLQFHVSLIRQMAQNKARRPVRFDILSPRVQVYGDTSVITYTRLLTYDDNGKPSWVSYNETRVFIKTAEGWRMVHFHRSPV